MYQSVQLLFINDTQKYRNTSAELIYLSDNQDVDLFGTIYGNKNSSQNLIIPALW